MNHIMLDVETMSTQPTAAILSIGAVRFDLDIGKILDELYLIVDFQSCIDLGLHVDAATVQFWIKEMSKPEMASAREIFERPGYHLTEAIYKLDDWIRTTIDNCMWGNGSTFDNAIVKNAYRVCGAQYPISYKHDLCYRTLKFLYDMKFLITDEKSHKPHNALEDARHQACKLMDMWSRIK